MKEEKGTEDNQDMGLERYGKLALCLNLLSWTGLWPKLLALEDGAGQALLPIAFQGSDLEGLNKRRFGRLNKRRFGKHYYLCGDQDVHVFCVTVRG